MICDEEESLTKKRLEFPVVISLTPLLTYTALDLL